MSSKDPIYKISFYNNNKIYELFARQISQSPMFGFLEVSELVFGNSTSVVVDPQEERLKQEFSGVETTYIPNHSIIRIDRVEEIGVGKIKDALSEKGGNISQFPLNIYNKEPTRET